VWSGGSSRTAHVLASSDFRSIVWQEVGTTKKLGALELRAVVQVREGLESRGFSRATAMAALGVHPADMTRYISVTEAVNGRLIESIGPAPAMGRSRWFKLGEALAALGHRRALPQAVEALLASDDFRALSSNERFNAVLAAVIDAGKAEQPSPLPLAPRQLGPLTVSHAARANAASLKLAGSGAEDFAAFLVSRLDALYAAYAAEGRSGAEN
jgi:ParB family chromosome partitioning protein